MVDICIARSHPGYFYQGEDDSQIAFWECSSDQKSEKHAHAFNEYMVCVSVEYTAYIDNKKIYFETRR